MEYTMVSECHFYRKVGLKFGSTNFIVLSPFTKFGSGNPKPNFLNKMGNSYDAFMG